MLIDIYIVHPESYLAKVPFWLHWVSRKLFLYCWTGTNTKVVFQGDHHRKQRKMLNPVFSIVNMRQMSKTSSIIIHGHVSHKDNSYHILPSTYILRGHPQGWFIVYWLLF